MLRLSQAAGAPARFPFGFASERGGRSLRTPSRRRPQALMKFALFALSTSQLQSLADSREPEDLAARAEPEAFPPAFVAARSLKLAGDAQPAPWSTSFLIVRKADNRFVGACGFKTAPVGGRVEVGYGVSPSARGAGAATAALQLLTALAFEAGASEVLAEVLPENTASTRVVQKAGYAQVGSRLDEGHEFVIQWRRHRSDMLVDHGLAVGGRGADDKPDQPDR